ncbi:hypothetical protein PPL_00905 [Heterostelium album PN500]|uniref:Uncharacterized protein n=1 Tax=Heterostelium pallidum (strain ATCC 26659 / Pp 5 / PN500) TaxID=670386 RepID=D3AYY6_HETP5|nr:hypothetical protein PPL_00905 [Heterostelium album PN500]EFA85676.1 hypothetical protein PPL_00905 [Heterostelium album PN500]|eukprot:XP_020437783.1 hypothetical protein PPL_00905 [Heterostelium album PN500]
MVLAERGVSQTVICEVHRYDKQQPSNFLNRVIALGRVSKQLDHQARWRVWAMIVFNNFIENHCNGVLTWGSSTNCQNFTRHLVSKLDLVWPDDIPIASDYAPMAIDLVSFYRDIEISSNTN